MSLNAVQIALGIDPSAKLRSDANPIYTEWGTFDARRHALIAQGSATERNGDQRQYIKFRSNKSGDFYYQTRTTGRGTASRPSFGPATPLANAGAVNPLTGAAEISLPGDGFNVPAPLPVAPPPTTIIADPAPAAGAAPTPRPPEQGMSEPAGGPAGAPTPQDGIEPPVIEPPAMTGQIDSRVVAAAALLIVGLLIWRSNA